MDGAAVREMAESDIDGVAAVRVRGWQTAYAGLMPRKYLDSMTVEADAARRREYFSHGRGDVINLVVEDDAGEVAGWACLGPYRDGDLPAGDAELFALYVRPELCGTGIGRALMTESLARAAERGFPRMRLWVLEGNVPARRFYERAGFAPDGGVQTYELAGEPVPEVRYARDLGPGDR